MVAEAFSKLISDKAQTFRLGLRWLQFLACSLAWSALY